MSEGEGEAKGERRGATDAGIRKGNYSKLSDVHFAVAHRHIIRFHRILVSQFIDSVIKEFRYEETASSRRIIPIIR